jgi:hypothetical protein
MTRRGIPVLRWVSGAVVVCIFAVSGCPGGAAPAPAGSTAAILSFIDAASGRVEVVRHWPGAAADVEVYPFVPYFWDSCPGPGAIMMLVTGPAGGPPLSERIAEALEGPLPASAPARAQISRIVDALRTPGAPVREELKTLTPWVSDLSTYERRGYAVFVFVHWQGIWCGVSVQAVPEGYGIPFVR